MRVLTHWSANLSGRARGRLDLHRTALRSRTYATAAFNAPTVEHEVVTVTTDDGARLRVHAYGPADAPVIVLVHGWTCAIEYWNAQINAFAGPYRVVAYDQRGHGESDYGTVPLSMDLLADDLNTVLDATVPTGEKAVLVGHSLGGMTLQAWAGRFPEQVPARAHAVLLTNTASGALVAETTVLPLFNRLLPRGLRIALPAWLGRRGLGTPVLLPPLLPIRWIFTRQIMHTNATRELVDYSMAVVRSCPARVRAAFGLLLAEMELGDAARHLVVPTTVIAGSADFMTPPIHAERIAATLTEIGSLVRHEVLETGHLGNVEAHERFNEELATLLDVVEDARRQVDAAVG
ncbi:alpha/beta fold hydrolase [Nocardia takedensis]